MRLRVLVVEHNPISRKWLCFALETAGYQAVEAADGAAALEAMQQHRPQLVLHNPELPDVDGLDLVGRLRSLAASDDPPILALAGPAGPIDPGRHQDLGFVGCLLKPVEPSRLLEAVRARLPLPPATEPTCGHDDVNTRLAYRLAVWESEISILAGLLEAVGAGSRADPVLGELLARFLDAAGVSKGAAYLRDADGRLRLRAQLGFPDPAPCPTPAGPADFFGHAELLHRAVGTGRPIVLPSSTLPANGAGDVLARAGARAVVIAPLVMGEERFGALVIAASRELGEDWIAFAEALGSRFCEALQLTRTTALLKQHEEHLERIVQTLAEGLLITDRHRRFTFANAAAERILGVPVAEMLQRASNDPPWKLTTPEGQPLAPEDYPTRQVLRTGRPLYGMEMGVTRPDGKRVILSVNSSLLRDAGENITGTVTSLTDITERRRQAEQLTRSNAELEQFSYVVAHDLKEPLRTVMSFTQLLAQRCRGSVDARAGEYIERAIGGARRMNELIDDLLAYARVGAQGRRLEPVGGETVFQSALANLQAAIAASGAEVVHDPLPTVTAEAGELGQLFQNLVGNALKFHGEAPPRVRVWAERTGDEWVFSVHDNGIGIDPQHAERVFQVFQRLHSRTEYSGNGIGLATCKKIVEAHGGRIWVESQPGQGATFRFTLPAEPAKA
ncbi:MAG TPA: ATP-binding protein [Bryobacterales bacterium]|nr:ATP-binding protein [Bryobacterales bacterium]